MVAGARIELATVHPHARGEHLRGGAKMETMTGSSPRPWGTLDRPRAALRLNRFIPTPVGNTVRMGSPRCRIAVHPHARGEHTLCRFSVPSSFGSSPRPWGTLLLRGGCTAWRRFIPTPVGNTHASFGSSMGSYGSSPRPWGTPEHPARTARGSAVHPHARGEH